MAEEEKAFLESGYDREVIDRVWSFAQTVSGSDDAVWRKDEFGAWIHRGDYHNRNSEFGWEIVDATGRARQLGTDALRPLQWQNYLDYQVAARHHAHVSADGLRNARRLV